MGKGFEKQTKTIKGQGKKQVVALKYLKPSDKELTPIKDFITEENQNPEIINEIKRIEEEEKKVKRNKMVYKATNKTYDFRKFKRIRASGSEIRNNVINMDMANVEKMNLIMHIKDFASKTKPRGPELKELKNEVLDSAIALLKGNLFLYIMHFKVEYFRGLKNHRRVKNLKY